MATYTALYDACVLYPAPLRDLLVSLAGTALFRARWTDQIHEEWIRNVVKKNPELTRDKLNSTRDKMNFAVQDSLITGYEPLVEALELPDPDDRHVLAAAIVGRANVIVTFNTRDFPTTVLQPFGIEAQHPDDFVLHQIDLHHPIVCKAVKVMRARMKNPTVSAATLLEILERQQLTQSAVRLREYEALL